MGLDGPGFGLCWGRGIISSLNPSRPGPAAHPASSHGQWGSSPGQSGRRVAMTTHFQSSAEVRTEYSYTFISLLYPHGCYWENFAFLYVQVSSLYYNVFCQPRLLYTLHIRYLLPTQSILTFGFNTCVIYSH